MPGLFTEPIGSVADALQRAVHLEELIGFVSQFGPEDVAVGLFLCKGGVVIARIGARRGLGCVLCMNSHQAFAKVRKRAIMPRPLGRNPFVTVEIEGVASRSLPLRGWMPARRDEAWGFFHRGGAASGLHDCTVYKYPAVALCGDWQTMTGFWLRLP